LVLGVLLFVFYYLLLRFFNTVYIMLDSMHVTMSVSTVLYPNLDL